MFAAVFIIVLSALVAFVALLLFAERLIAARNPRYSDLSVDTMTTPPVPHDPWWKDFEATLWDPARSKELEEASPNTDAVEKVNPAYAKVDALRRRH